MKVLVTGAKGQLGSDVVNELTRRGHEVVGVDISELDITDAEQVVKVIGRECPDAVIHCAAWTAVDAAPEDLPVIADSIYHTIRANQDNIIIVLK